MSKIKKEEVKFMYMHKYGNENVYFFKVNENLGKSKRNVVADNKAQALEKLLNNEHVTSIQLTRLEW